MLCATNAHAQRVWYHGFVFDALTGCGPIPVSEEEFARFEQGKDSNKVALKVPCDTTPPRPWRFKDREGIPLAILNASFMADYNATSAQINRGSGVIEVRGYTPVGPATVAPDTHGGGRAVASVNVVPVTQAQIEAQLFDPAQMSVPSITLASQGAELAAASRSFDDDIREFEQALRQVEPPRSGPQPPCGAAQVTPTSLQRCVDSLSALVAANDDCSESRPMGNCRSSADACALNVAAPWNSLTFSCVLRAVDTRISDLRRLRARLNEYSFGAASQHITVTAAQLTGKLTIYRDNLAAARAASRHVRAIYMLDNAGTGRETISAVRKAELKKQVKERYGASSDEATINQQVKLRENSGEFDRYMKELRTVLNELDATTTTRSNDLNDNFHDLGGRQLFSLPGVAWQDQHVRDEFEALTTHVEQVNTNFARLFDGINAAHIRYREPQPKVIALDLRTGAGTNRVVLTTLTSAEHFVPYRFDVPGDAPAAPQGAVAQGALLSANPNASVVLASSNVTPGVSRNFEFQLHRMWDATITGGFFASTRNPVFGTRSGKDSDVVTVIGHASSGVHFGMGITWFPWQEDTYPDTHWMLRNRVGLLVAAAVDEQDHYYLGRFWSRGRASTSRRASIGGVRLCCRTVCQIR